MVESLKNYLSKSVSAYHAIREAVSFLRENGYEELKENSVFKIEANKKYYIVRDGSSLIAINTNGLENAYNIVASHTDSPVLSIKYNADMKVKNYTKLNVEIYGGTLLYTWLDKPLKIAGRVICKNKTTQNLESKLINSKSNLIIPSVAIHMNREANNGLTLNQQRDMCVLSGLDITENTILSIIKKEINENEYEIKDYDLICYNATENFYAGINNEFLCSPRIDNLTSVYSSIYALNESKGKNICLAVLFDNEEVGSQTKQGAGGKFLIDTIKRINRSLNRTEDDLDIGVSNSFFVSLDNAHALHPNRPDLNDPTNDVLMGKGIVVKHHANKNYTTDAFSSSIIKDIFKNNGVEYQDFFMKSDMRCGGTLGAISQSQLSIKSVDIGLGQLAMHSTMETMSVKDYNSLVKGLIAFYNSKINFVDYDKVKIED